MRVALSASFHWIAWKLLMVFPNAWRSCDVRVTVPEDGPDDEHAPSEAPTEAPSEQ